MDTNELSDQQKTYLMISELIRIVNTQSGLGMITHVVSTWWADLNNHEVYADLFERVSQYGLIEDQGWLEQTDAEKHAESLAFVAELDQIRSSLRCHIVGS
jgi:hypothetical protein